MKRPFRLITNGYYLPYNPDLKMWARKLRKNMTKTEKKLWYQFLRKLPIPVLRQKPLDGFIVDFYCSKAKLVIEVDGGQHYTKKGLAYDKQRTKILESYGIKVVRFLNSEVNNNFRGVCVKLSTLISPYFTQQK